MTTRGTRNNSRAIAAATRVAESADVNSADVKADGMSLAEFAAANVRTESAEDFAGIESLKLFAEYVRNNVGKSGNASARIGKGARVILDEFITRERDSFGTIVADDETRRLAIEIHKAVTGRRVRNSGYVQITASESARELIVRLSEERERARGNDFVGIERYKRWYATQSRTRSGGGGSARLDVDGKRAAAAAAIAALEADAS